MHAELRYSLAFTEDGDWLFAPDTHDRGLRILHVPSGKTYPVLQGEGPFYKAVALAVPASMVAFLRPGDEQGGGPYGLEVWRLDYQGSRVSPDGRAPFSPERASWPWQSARPRRRSAPVPRLPTS